MEDVTEILVRMDRGDDRAAEQLLPLVYEELCRLASFKLSRESPGDSLETTALVHEAYVRLVDQSTQPKWNGRGHFFAAAAEAMRRILVERARSRARLKRGGKMRRVDLDERSLADIDRMERFLELDDALSKLEQSNRDAATLVKLRYFAEFSHQESAEILGISRRAADRLWVSARAWLKTQLPRN